MGDETYVVQHFGYSARTLVNSVYNVSFDYLKNCVDILETAVSETLKDKAPADLEHRMQELFGELSTSLNKDCDRLQLFTERNLMRVPSYVLLPGDEIHRSPDSDAIPVAVLKAQAATLKKRIAQEKVRQEALRHELAQQEVTRRHLRSVMEKICAVLEGLPQASIASWSTTTVPEGSYMMGGGGEQPTPSQHDSTSLSDLTGSVVPKKPHKVL
ncbi:uncharacterized protein LOC144155847 isoform X2 [Haemaphysalis longicornis]